MSTEAPNSRRFLRVWGFILSALAGLFSPEATAQPPAVLDLADAAPETLLRVYGSRGTGELGVPVAAGSDCDGDGRPDVAVAYFTAPTPAGDKVGEIDLIFGDGRLAGSYDTAEEDPSILRILGAAAQETAGNEIWMDDVTGDGVGDLLIGRQNATPRSDRIGAGALTILVGGPELRARAAELAPVELASPHAEVTLTTLFGARALDRLGIWMRTGDVDADGIADIVVAADQEDQATPSEINRGAVYVIRGGPHLASGGAIDLADFGATALSGHIAKITPPPGSERFHFGATCQIADLDGNRRGEVLMAATLFRGGASVMAAGAPLLSAEAEGGSAEGTLFIAWDDNFGPAPWPAGFAFDISSSPGGRTILDGGSLHRKFGEEILGGLDFDADSRADLFVGDLIGGDLPDRERPGLGHVFYDAASLKGLVLDMDALPPSLRTTTIVGPSALALEADTATQGDWNRDGIADLAVTAPYANPRDRVRAGVIHVLYGRPGGWPRRIDTRPGALPPPELLRLSEIRGARGALDGDRGDTIGYSAASADLDGDGRTDLIANEMLGNGLRPEAVDVGNLIALSGATLSGSCRSSAATLCLQRERFAFEIAWRDFENRTGLGRVVPSRSRDAGLFWFFDAGNWEILTKALDGCSINGHFWVFAAATTNVEYTLTVTDTWTGEVRTYFNPLGTSAEAITDTAAFATCP